MQVEHSTGKRRTPTAPTVLSGNSVSANFHDIDSDSALLVLFSPRSQLEVIYKSHAHIT